MQTVAVFGRLGKALGSHSPPRAIITSAILAAMSIFYVFTLAILLKVTVYPLQNRVTYYAPFESYVVSSYADHVFLGCGLFVWMFFSLRGIRRLISIAVLLPVLYGALTNSELLLGATALATLPAVLSILAYNALKRNHFLASNSHLTLNYLAMAGFGLAVLGIVIASMQMLAFQSSPVRNYTFEIFLVLALVTPVFMLMMISSVPIKIIIESGKKLLKVQGGVSLPEDRMRARTKIVLLSLSVALSLVVAIIPHLSSINEDSQQIGVDTSYYVGWVELLSKSQGPSEFWQQLFVVINEGDRPFSLLFIYAVAAAAGIDAFSVIEYLPLLFGPPLVLVIYFLTRQLTSSDRASVAAAFITAVSYQTLIGIYAGFYSNWFSLIAGYIAFIVLIRHLKRPSYPNVAIFSGLMLFLLFSHVYTWSTLALSMGLFLAVTFKLNPHQRKSIAILSLVVVSTAVIDVSRIVLLGEAGGLERELRVAENQAGTDQFTFRWNNLRYGMHTFLGGLFANFVILALGLYWLYRSKAADLSGIFILTSLSVGLLPLLFGDWVIQTRVLYNIPFQIPAAIAIVHLTRQTRGTLIAVSACILMVWIAVVAVTNFYLVLPQLPPIQEP